MTEARTRRLLFAAFALGAALRVAWQAWIAADPSSWFPHGNAAGFIRVARTIMAGDLLAGTEPFFYGPLYPYFLASCFSLAGGENLVVPRALQAVAGLAIAALCFRIGRRAFGPAAGLAASALLLVYGPGLFFEGLLVAETLSTLLLLLGVDLVSGALERGGGPFAGDRGMVLGGLALGFAAWGRGNALLLVPVVAGLAWLAGRAAGADGWRPLRGAVLVLVGAAAAVLPVSARNLVVGGDRVLLVSQGGINLFLGNNPEARGWFGLAERAGIVTDVDPGYFANTQRVAEAAVGRPLRPSEISGYWTGRALDWIRAEPAAAARLVGRKILLLVDPYELPIHRTAAYYLERFPLGFALPGFGLVLPLALAGAVLVRPWRALHVGLVAITAAYAASVVVFFVCDRYRFPLAPLLAPFAGLALARFAQAARGMLRGERPEAPARVGAALVVLLAAAALLNSRPGRDELIPTEMRAGFLAIEHHRHGQAWESLGDLPAALAEYERAVTVAPGHVESRLRQAAVLIALGRDAEARVILETLLALRPDDAEAQRLLRTVARFDRPGANGDHPPTSAGAGRWNQRNGTRSRRSSARCSARRGTSAGSGTRSSRTTARST